jgi:hypothetical protein
METKASSVVQEQGRSEQSTALVASPVEAAALAVNHAWFGRGAVSLHNFGDDTEEVLRYTSLATDDESIAGSSLVGQTLEIVRFYAHPITLEDAEGEIKDCVRVVLFGKDDLPIAFVSQGVQGSLARIAMVKGLRPWQPPVKVQVRQIKTSKKFNFLTLVYAG